MRANAPELLVSAFEPWATLYADSGVLPTIVVFGHIAALVLAGGLAVTLDRATLRLSGVDHDERRRHLDDLSSAHRSVLFGLALSAATGVLLFASDVETYYGSPIFWTKMTLVLLLLVNGYAMTRAETRLRTGQPGGDAWATLRRNAMASLFLWFATAFVGVALVNS